jgi:hypothetical protein
MFKITSAGHMLAAAMLISFAQPAAAQAQRPAKMVLILGQSVAVTDYPSMAKCEAAEIALRKAIMDSNEGISLPQRLPNGGSIYTTQTGQPRTFCVPS